MAVSSPPSTEASSKDVGMGTFVLALTLGILSRAYLSSRIRLPYTCLILISGLLYGFLIYTDVRRSGPDIFSASSDLWINLSPEAILTVILPILIFGSSFSSDLHLFLQQLTPVLTLAGPAVLVNTILLGVTVKYILPYGWDWATSFMVASIFSATDPVAVVAILKDLGVTESLSILIDGESLLNDGLAIVLYSIFSRLVLDEEGFQLSETVQGALVLCLGGPVIGIMVGVLASIILGVLLNDAASEITVTILCGYGSYLLADLAEASGVLSMVTAGLYLSFHGLGRISARVTASLSSFWAMASFIAETIIFFVSGLIIADKALISSTIRGTDWLYLIILYLIVNVTRFIGVFLFFPSLARGPYGIDWRQGLLLSWGGLRGAVSLTLSMAVSQQEAIPLDTRARILFLTAGIVLLTILINGATCKLLVQKLRLVNPTQAERELFIRATNLVETKLGIFVERKLKKDRYLGNADWNVVYRYLPVYTPQIYWYRIMEGKVRLSEEEVEEVGRSGGGRKSWRRRKEGGGGGGGGRKKTEDIPLRLRSRWKSYTTQFNEKLKDEIDGLKLSAIRKQIWDGLMQERGVSPSPPPL
ncbi:sodium hydrogen exchanger partial, partial [Nannochloropsis oceanica]